MQAIGPVDRLARRIPIAWPAGGPICADWCASRRVGKGSTRCACACRRACLPSWSDLSLDPAQAQMPGGPPPAVGVVRVQNAADHRNLGIRRPHPGGRARRPGRPRHRLPRAAAVHRRRRGEQGRPALCAGAAAVPGRPGGQDRRRCSRCRRSCRTPRSPINRAASLLQHAGRPAIHRGRRARHHAVGRRPGAERRGAGAAVADQPGLHRDPRADRRQDRPHRGHRRQRRLARFRRAGDHRQPGPDVRGVPGRGARRAGPARTATPTRAASAPW